MNADNSRSIRVGTSILTATPVRGMVRLDIDRHVESPVFRETIPLYMQPHEVRDAIALLAAALEPKTSDPAHLTRLQGICAKVRARFAAQSESAAAERVVDTGMDRSERVVGFIRRHGEVRGEYEIRR